MAKSVTNVYGEALFHEAMSSDRFDRVVSDAEKILGAFEGKCAAEEAMKDLTPEMQGLLSVVVEKGRDNELRGILEAFLEIRDRECKIGRATVKTAKELSDAKRAEVIEKLKSTTSYRELKVDFVVEPELVGGMVITVGDRMLDTSVKTKLERMGQELCALKLS